MMKYMQKKLWPVCLKTATGRKNRKTKKGNVNWYNCTKQSHFCVKLLRKTKQDYLNNTDIKCVSDNKKFWKTIKPYFSNKRLNSNKILWSEKRFVKDPIAVETTMNDYFVNITQTIRLEQPQSNHANNQFAEHTSILE